MAKWNFSIPSRNADGNITTLQGEVSAPKDDHATRREVRDALEDHARKQGCDPIEIGLYPKR